MDLEFSHAQQEIKDWTAEFANREARYPAEVSEKLFGAGFTGLGVPEEHGGVVRTFSPACG